MPGLARRADTDSKWRKGRLCLPRCKVGGLVMYVTSNHGPLRVGVGGPVGSGKTALMERCASACATATRSPPSPTTSTPNGMPNIWCARARWSPIASPASKPAAARTPPSARTPRPISPPSPTCGRNFPALDLVLIESGGDNLAATFSPELADLTIYVIDVAAGDKIPSKGGPGITRSDLLVINKVDLAPHVGASLETMERESQTHARRAAVRVHQSARRQRRRRDRKLSSRRRAG